MAVERPASLPRLAAFCLAIVASFALRLPAFAERPAGGFPATRSDQERALRARSELVAASLFSGLAWRPDGPDLPAGRVTDIEGIPGRPYGFYLGFATAGLWRTDNNGASFTPLGGDLPSPAIGDLAIDPLHPERLWVGTGDPDPGAESRGGFGLYRSDDGGKSFRFAGLGDSDRIARIVVDPRDGERLFVAVAGKLHTPGGARGVYRSADGGASWERVFDSGGAENSGFTGAIDLAMDPQDSRILYCATWQRSRRPWELVAGGVGSAIYKSADGGDSWQRLEGGLPSGSGVGRIGLAVAAGSVYAAIDLRDPLPEAEWELGGGAVDPLRLRRMSREEFLSQNPAEVAAFLRRWPAIYPGIDAAGLIAKVESGEIRMADILARLEAADPGIFRREIRGVEIYRSADGGASWKRSHAQPLRRAAGFEGFRFGRIVAAPDDPARVYFLGEDLIVSGDFGKTFFGAAGAGAGHHALWIDPVFPRRLWLGGDGGLAASYDGGTSWSRLLPAAPPPAIAAMPAALPPFAPAASSGNLPYGRLSSYASSPRVPGVLWAGSDDGQVWVSEDGGGSWSEVDDALPAARRVSAIVASRHQDGRAFVALYGRGDDDITPYLFRGAENGRSWTAIAGNLPAEPILAIAEDPLNGEILYAGTERGFYASLDRGDSWQALAAGLPAASVAALEIVGDELVATLAGRGVYRLALAPLRELPRLLAADPPVPVALFPVAPVAAQEGWYVRRDPWRRADPAGEPRLRVVFFTAQDLPAELRLLDAEGQVLRRIAGDARRGIAAFEWDLLLDERLALQAEEATVFRVAREKAAQDKEAAERERKGRKRQRGKKADDEDSPPVAPPVLEKGALARTPWAEALRLGRPLYVTPGSYTLEVQVGEATSRTLLVVSPPATGTPQPGDISAP